MPREHNQINLMIKIMDIREHNLALSPFFKESYTISSVNNFALYTIAILVSSVKKITASQQSI